MAAGTETVLISDTQPLTRGTLTRARHLGGAGDWTLDADRYVPASLTQEGFVHLSGPHQVRRVAEARFAGREDLLLLVIDPQRLDVAVVWEDTSGDGEAFPHAHAYGSLPRSAVVAAHAYSAGADGRFPPPWQISDLVASPAEPAGEPSHPAPARWRRVRRRGPHGAASRDAARAQGQQVLTAPDDEVAVADLDEITVVLHRPVIAHDG